MDGLINNPVITGYFSGLQKRTPNAQELRYLKKLVKSKNDKAFSVFGGKEYIGQVGINQIYWPAKAGRLFLIIRGKVSK